MLILGTVAGANTLLVIVKINMLLYDRRTLVVLMEDR